MVALCGCSARPVLNGASYHFERHDSQGQRFNEQNYGLGLEVPVGENKLQAGVLKNSFTRTQPYIVFLHPLASSKYLSCGLFAGAAYDLNLNPVGGAYLQAWKLRASIMPDIGQEGGGLLFLQIIL